MAKDYTLMHACGLEEYHESLSTAKATGKKHAKDCELENERVYLDESKDKELSGRYWVLDTKAGIWVVK